MLLRFFLSLCFVSTEAYLFCVKLGETPENVSDSFHVNQNAKCEPVVQPYPHVAFALLAVGVMLCAAVHFFYIAVCSRMFCCDSHGCTKTNVAALFSGVSALLFGVIVLMEIVNGFIYPHVGNVNLTVYHCMVMGALLSITPALALFYTSISDVACPGNACTKMGRCRYCTYGILWFLAVLHVAQIFYAFIRETWEGLEKDKDALYIAETLFVLLLVYSTISVGIAHKKMHDVSLCLLLYNILDIDLHLLTILVTILNPIHMHLPRLT